MQGKVDARCHPADRPAYVCVRTSPSALIGPVRGEETCLLLLRDSLLKRRLSLPASLSKPGTSSCILVCFPKQMASLYRRDENNKAKERERGRRGEKKAALSLVTVETEVLFEMATAPFSFQISDQSAFSQLPAPA